MDSWKKFVEKQKHERVATAKILKNNRRIIKKRVFDFIYREFMKANEFRKKELIAKDHYYFTATRKTITAWLKYLSFLRKVPDIIFIFYTFFVLYIY